MDLDSVRYIFDTSVLKKGDILLINTYNERLQERMKSNFDHVALYAGDAFIIESDGGGVVLNHIFSYGFCDITDAIVLRLDKYSELICEGVLFYARCTMGMEFGAMDAGRVPEYKDTDKRALSNRMFCSRLVAQSYEKMGVNLVPNPSYCTPASFLDSKYLVKVENAMTKADNDVKKVMAIHNRARESSENVEILVDVFQKMSAVFGSDIQSLDQLIWAAIRNPDREEEAVKVLYQTDYYTRRLKGREDYCLNDRDAFGRKYDTPERRIWFLLNQHSHLTQTYIPSVSANAQSFNVLTALYPNSKVIAFFRNLFIELEGELSQYLAWVYRLLTEINKEEPELYHQIVENKE